jgi:hypothetical protein
MYSRTSRKAECTKRQRESGIRYSSQKGLGFVYGMELATLRCLNFILIVVAGHWKGLSKGVKRPSLHLEKIALC